MGHGPETDPIHKLQRMKIFMTPHELVGEQATPIYQYRATHSEAFQALQKAEEGAQVSNRPLDRQAQALYEAYESKLIDYEDTIASYFWTLGMAVAMAEYHPGIPLKDNPALLQRIEQPEIPGLDQLGDIVATCRMLVEEHLPPNKREKLLKHYKLGLQEAWGIRYYAFVNGYEWTLCLLKNVGYKGNAENIAWIYRLLD